MFSPRKPEKSHELEYSYDGLPMPVIENLVFEGGGVKGAAYLGVLEALDERDVLDKIKRVGGSSAGAITALLVGLGLSVSQIKTELYEHNFIDFMDPIPGHEKDLQLILQEKLAKLITVAMDTPNYGILKGERFLNWAKDCITKVLGNPDATFKDLHDYILSHPNSGLKDIYVTASNITSDKLEIFSFETVPDMPIALAVRASMSFPAAFEAVRYQIPGRNKEELFVDGGLFENYPLIVMFDKINYVPKGYEVFFHQTEMNPSVLGIKIDTADEIARIFWNIRSYQAVATMADKPTKGVKLHHVSDASNWKEQYGISHLYGRSSLYNPFGGIKLTANVDQATKEHEYRERTSHRSIQTYDCGIKTLKFDLTAEDLESLRLSGKNATEIWWHNYREGAELAMLIPKHIKLVTGIQKMSLEELLFLYEKNKDTLKELKSKSTGASATESYFYTGIAYADTYENLYALEKAIIARVGAELKALAAVQLAEAQHQTPKKEDLELVKDSIFANAPEALSENELTIIASLRLLVQLNCEHLTAILQKERQIFNKDHVLVGLPQPINEDLTFNSAALETVKAGKLSSIQRQHYQEVVMAAQAQVSTFTQYNTMLETLTARITPQPSQSNSHRLG